MDEVYVDKCTVCGCSFEPNQLAARESSRRYVCGWCFKDKPFKYTHIVRLVMVDNVMLCEPTDKEWYA